MKPYSRSTLQVTITMTGKMFCAECGKRKTRTANGSWYACCNGNGYWYDGEPLPKDRWWPMVKHGAYYFFFNVKWPILQEPVPPNEETV